MVGAGGTGEEGDHRNVEEEVKERGRRRPRRGGGGGRDSSARSIFMEVQAPKRRRKKGEAAKVRVLHPAPLPPLRLRSAIQTGASSALLTGEE